MPRIFISYRRDDSIGIAGRIYDRLKSHFGAHSVLMDVSAMPVGVDFRRHLADEISGCDIVLALIGEQWLTISQNGQRRLDDPKDLVRIEIETALQRDIHLIPVLLAQTAMPRPEDLPAAMSDLSWRNAAQVDPGRRFDNDLEQLIGELERTLRKGTRHNRRDEKRPPPLPRSSKLGPDSDDEPRADRGRPRDQRGELDLARGSLRGPGLAMLAVGILSFLLNLSIGLFGFYDHSNPQATRAQSAPKPDEPPPPHPGALPAAILMCGLAATSLLGILASACMLKMRIYWLAVVGSFAMLLGGSVCVVGFPIGIWALIVLFRGDVASHFP